MTAPLPHGLFKIVSTTQVDPIPSEPADVIFERLQALHNFWKVHNAQSRTSWDAPNIRSRQLFWRVWSDSKLSLRLDQSKLIQLWMQCQHDFDLSPFEFRITDTSGPNKQEAREVAVTSPHLQRQSWVVSERPRSSSSISPSHVTPAEERSELLSERQNDGMHDQRADPSPQTTNSRLSLVRSTSGSGSGSRKRTSFPAANPRGRSRPSVTRKRSSQSQQNSENSKPRTSIKSPRPSAAGPERTSGASNLNRAFSSQMTASPASTELSSRRISALELPSASSWQSVDSHADPRSTSTVPASTQNPTSLIIDRNFRGKFVETQKQLHSSTNLAGMSKMIRKSGSVVRFADEVDLPEDLRLSQVTDRVGSPHHRTTSEDQPQAWRQGLQRHDSVGSVAAVSDDGTEDLEAHEDDTTMLPRTRSQLSLGIADLKRSQSTGQDDTAFAVTSPQIEEEQDALIKGEKTKQPSEEEEKLLAMGRKDGVTRAGGVNLPKELIVEGKFELGEGFEPPEEPLY